ncbi:Caudovirus, tape measure, N-terminal [uncultured Caudovirales phage]|uniref:Caudovirus, tape measure, N-terminal n=1 Tax=uncultured Caudovirales phage TaxID=2100421 RepID=A0A6J5QE04_9CAUD|nr:Caudovirus, tape measure, N-terminal [uncultured Caudovirales phage]
MAGENDGPKLGFEVDTSGLTKAQQETAKTQKSVEDLAGSMKKLADGTKVSASEWAIMNKTFDLAGGHGMKAADALNVMRTRQQDATKSTKEHSEAMHGAAGAAGELAEMIGHDIGHGLSHAFGTLGVSMAKAGEYASTLLGRGGLLAVGVTAATVAYYEFNKELSHHVDQLTTWNQKLTYAIGTQVQATDTFNHLYESAQRLGAPLGSVIDQFGQLSASGRSIGASRQEMERFVEIIGKIGNVSGASPDQVSGGVQSLSRMLADGHIEGRALYALLNRFPGLAIEIAKGFGVSVEQLKLMGTNGELSGKKLMDAILSREPDLDKMMKDMPTKFSEATTRMGNAWDEMIAKFGKKVGAQASGVFQAGMLTRLFEFAGHGMDDKDPAKDLEWQRKRYMENTEPLTTLKIGALGPGDTKEHRDEMIAYHASILIEAYKKAAPSLAALPAADAKAKEDAERAPVMRGLTIAQERDTLTATQKRLQVNIKDIEDSLGTGRETEEEGKRLRSTLVLLQTQLRLSGSAFEILTRKTHEMASDMHNFGGSTTGLAFGSEVRGILDQSAKEGRAVSFTQAGREVVNQRAMQGLASAEGIEYGAEKTRRRTELVGRDREYTRNVTAGEAGMDWLRQNVPDGAPITSKLIEAINAQIRAAEHAAEAMDAEALAEGRLRDVIDMRAHNARQQVIGEGPEAVRRATAEAAAREADRKLPGSGQFVLNQEGRRAEERRNVRVDALTQSTLYQQRQIETGGDPAAMRRLAVEQRVLQSNREGGGQKAEDLIRSDEANKITIAYQQQVRSLKEQTVLANQMAALNGLSRQEETVQVALLQKEKELLASGVDYTHDEYMNIMRTTEALARANINLEAMREQSNDIRGIWEAAGQGIGDAFNNSLFSAFQKGETMGQKFANGMAAMLRNVGSQMMNALVFNPMTKSLSAAGDEFLGPLFKSMGFLRPGQTSGAGAAAATSGGIPLIGDFPVMAAVGHTGWDVGSPASSNRSVPMAMFTGAPRFHKGLGPNEFPAILERGETVTPRGGKSGGDMNVVNNITVTSSGDAQKDGDIIAARVTDAMRGVARSVITDELRPGGVLRK